MSLKPFVRKEFKNKWEGRAPLSPEATERLVQAGYEVQVQPSRHRCFGDQDYVRAGATLQEDDRDARLVLGIKEPKPELVRDGQIHLCFSHTIKGQDYNMGLLRRFLEGGCTLIDYEVMKDPHGIRTIAFGRYAGIAGAVDSFHVAGKKLAAMGKESVFQEISMTWAYARINTLKASLQKMNPNAGYGPRVLVTGTGNVGRGAIEVCRWLGLPELTLDQVLAGEMGPEGPWFAVAGTEDLVRHKDGDAFNKAEYRAHGNDRYESHFERFLGRFDVLLQTPYWEAKYPSVLDRPTMAAHRDSLPPVIGDISCDIDGSIAATLRESSIDEPAFTYHIDDHRIEDGIHLFGPTVMAIGHLPCELSIDATLHFSSILTKKMDELTAIDLTKPFENCGLGRELSEATIVYKGELTPNFRYLEKFL